MKFPITLLCLALWACNQENREGFLGSAVLDSPTIKISSELPGKVLWTQYTQGQMLQNGQKIAQLDTSALHLQMREIQASSREYQENLGAKYAERDPLITQMASLKKEEQRLLPLIQSSAVPSQKLDEIRDQWKLLQSKKSALEQSLGAAKGKTAVFEAGIARLQDQIQRALVLSPAKGVVRSVFVRSGEVVRPGQVLLEIQKIDTLEASFFAPQALLSSLALGQNLKLRVEEMEGKYRLVPAQIVWIANEAQFTPKGSQTRENRAELVFEVRLRVANPQGLLHPGLPLEVWR